MHGMTVRTTELRINATYGCLSLLRQRYERSVEPLRWNIDAELALSICR